MANNKYLIFLKRSLVSLGTFSNLWKANPYKKQRCQFVFQRWTPLPRSGSNPHDSSYAPNGKTPGHLKVVTTRNRYISRKSWPKDHWATKVAVSIVAEKAYFVQRIWERSFWHIVNEVPRWLLSLYIGFIWVQRVKPPNPQEARGNPCLPMNVSLEPQGKTTCQQGSGIQKKYLALDTFHSLLTYPTFHRCRGDETFSQGWSPRSNATVYAPARAAFYGLGAPRRLQRPTLCVTRETLWRDRRRIHTEGWPFIEHAGEALGGRCCRDWLDGMVMYGLVLMYGHEGCCSQNQSLS